MDKSLESFLHPKRSPNVKFKIPSFDTELEMRQLTVDETVAVDKEAAAKGWTGGETIMHYAAESLVMPNLHNVELQDALAEQVGHKIIDPFTVYRALFTGPESSQIVAKYIDIANLGVSFSEKVETAKN
jgi:hypothetical protein